ncbi:MAG: allantoate amidohydrolase [Ornithinimicrobium sp.]
MWADLEGVGRASSGGYRRFVWTAQDHTLREWFAGECARRDLDLTEDRVGNQWAWWGDPDAAVAVGRPGVAIGSHLDSVPDGGAYDGPLGVVSAFAAIDALRERGLAPAAPLAVVNFVDEEGARFGVACAGSRVLTGAMTADRALALTDADGLSMAEALTAAGRDPRRVGADPEALRRVGSFVELHVEQGRGLVDLGQAVGLASDLWPHGRWRIDLPGEANHAGTTAMGERRDAVISMAQVTLAARDLAIRHGCVATVGKVRITPGGVNAIASHVTAWLDARGSRPDTVSEVVAALTQTVESLGGRIVQESWTPATPFDSVLTQRLGDVLSDVLGDRRIGSPGGKPPTVIEGLLMERAAAAGSGDTTDPVGSPPTISVPVLGTGAGHDAGILASAGIPTAMLFVRNPTGVSHSPAEFAERADCHAGVAALTGCIIDLTDAAPPNASTAGVAEARRQSSEPSQGARR